MSNPAVLQDVVQGIGMATGNPAILRESIFCLLVVTHLARPKSQNHKLYKPLVKHTFCNRLKGCGHLCYRRGHISGVLMNGSPGLYLVLSHYLVFSPELLGNPQLLANLSDPDNIQQ